MPLLDCSLSLSMIGIIDDARTAAAMMESKEPA
jgi:hypothetical protein